MLTTILGHPPTAIQLCTIGLGNSIGNSNLAGVSFRGSQKMRVISLVIDHLFLPSNR
jgi:hypothetical protein